MGAALLLALLFAFTPARAAVRFDVFFGYDGIVPEASWFPVTFEIFNDGPGFNGVVEVVPTQYDRNQTRMVVELPTGTTKRFVIPMFASGRYTMSWDARLLDERGKTRAETLGIRVRKINPWRMPLMAAITRTAPVLPEIKPRQPDLQPMIARLQPSLFPDNPITLDGLDTIYLNSERALDLKVNQVNALLAWLHGGGHLIIGVEQSMHITGNEWLRPLLPCDVNGMTMLNSHAELQQWLTSSRRYDGTEYQFFGQPASPGTRSRPANRSTPEAFPNPYAKLKSDDKFEQAPLQVAVGAVRDGTVVIGSSAAPLAVTAKRGRGQLTVLLFSPELEPFVTWMNRPYFWAKMSELPPELLALDQYNRYGGSSLDGVFGAMIDSKQVRKLPVGWLLLLLIGYLIVIGPLDQYWLKKINRQMLTWLTFPAYVALFSVLIYFIGYKLRAGESEWNELHVVDVLPVGEKADVRGHTFASVYSPVNATYRLASELPFATLRGEFMGSYGGQEGSRASVEQHGNSFQAEIAVPVWTSQLFISDWWQRGEPPLSFTITTEGENRFAEVVNRLDKRVTRAMLVFNDQALDLGELGARQTKKIRLSGSAQPLASFVTQYGNSFAGAVNQRRQAFGDNRAQISDIPRSVMAASFVSRLTPPQQQYMHPGQFITPPGLDLSPLAERGDAILLAWVPGHAPVQPINKFSPRRTQRDTLFRVVAAGNN